MINALFIAWAAIPAAPAQTGLILWNNLQAGISKAEFKALWPKRITPLGEGCFAEIGAGFNRGRLESVSLASSMKDTNKRCADVVSSSLRAKYGKPVAEDRDVQIGDCGNSYGSGLTGALAKLCKSMGGEDPKTSLYYRWISNGVEITLKRSGDNEAEWSAVYRPAVTTSDEIESKL